MKKKVKVILRQRTLPSGFAVSYNFEFTHLIMISLSDIHRNMFSFHVVHAQHMTHKGLKIRYF